MAVADKKAPANAGAFWVSCDVPRAGVPPAIRTVGRLSPSGLVPPSGVPGTVGGALFCPFSPVPVGLRFLLPALLPGFSQGGRQRGPCGCEQRCQCGRRQVRRRYAAIRPCGVTPLSEGSLRRNVHSSACAETAQAVIAVAAHARIPMSIPACGLNAARGPSGLSFLRSRVDAVGLEFVRFYAARAGDLVASLMLACL